MKILQNFLLNFFRADPDYSGCIIGIFSPGIQLTFYYIPSFNSSTFHQFLLIILYNNKLKYKLKIMKKIMNFGALLIGLSSFTFAQQSITVPSAVKSALNSKYPESHSYHITWEKEKGNYEANWGGKDGEANSAQFTPKGEFIEIVKEIPSKDLPKNVFTYVNEHYKGAKLNDIGKALDAKGKTSYEVEIHGKDVIFDENGNFVKMEK